MPKLAELKFVIFDVETTGLEPAAGDRIVEIGAIKVEGNKIVDKFNSMLNPGRPVSAGAFAVNGITAQLLKDAPLPSEVIPKFMEFIKGNTLFAYNANFDAGFLKQELALLGFKLPQDSLIIDMLAMSRTFLPRLERHALSFVARHFGLMDQQKHRALDDVEMSFKVLQKLFALASAQGLDELAHIKNIFCIDKEIVGKGICERINEIQKAINLGAKLKIIYFSSFSKEFSERMVTPKGVTKLDGKDCLAGYCHLKKEERNFRIDGILHLEII